MPTFRPTPPDWSRPTIFSPDPWIRSALLVWTAILLAVCGRGLFSPRANSVYPIFAEAGRHWLEGADLYHPVGDIYRYSPFVAALFAPFGRLPDALGGTLWRLVNAS